MKRIVITGLGGVGGFYGGMLARAFPTNDRVAVYFVARGTHGQEIKRNGLRVEMPTGSFTARPSDVVGDPADLRITADYVLCCTKSYDLEDAIDAIFPVIGERTVVVPLLNGADIRDRVASLMPDVTVWYGLTYIVSMKVAPGIIRNEHGRGKVLFGSGGNRCEAGDELENILREAGIQAAWHDDIRLQVWKKYIIISVSATVSTYFDLPVLQAFNRHPDTCNLLLREAISVARAEGFDLEEEHCRLELLKAWGGDYNSTTSMHRDFRDRRPTEVNSLCGYIVREAARLGLEVPAYREIYRGLKVGISR